MYAEFEGFILSRQCSTTEQISLISLRLKDLNRFKIANNVEKNPKEIHIYSVRNDPPAQYSNSSGSGLAK